MAAGRRTPRDDRRRRLGQNFLLPDIAERFVAEAEVQAGELVVDIGAGSGEIARALSRRAANVVAIEVDPVWARQLRTRSGVSAKPTEKDRGDTHAHGMSGSVRVIERDVRQYRWPRAAFRVVACLPFGLTTDILRHLLDEPRSGLQRADLVVQWEVARKRVQMPPRSLLSAGWAPWWEFRLGRRIPARAFRPRPSVDGGVLTITRRAPPVLPVGMAEAYLRFVRENWSRAQ